MVDIPILLVAAVVLGAILNVIRGAAKPDSGEFSVKLLTGSLVVSVLVALGTINLINVEALGGPVVTFITGLVFGFAGDFTVTKLKNR